MPLNIDALQNARISPRSMPLRAWLATTLGALCILQGCSTVGSTGQEDSVAQPSLTVGEIIDDNALENRLREGLLSADPRFADARLYIVSHNARVLMTGQVASADMIAQATEVARNNRRIRILHNELTVSESPSLDVRASDQWISVRVKSRMLADADFPSRKVVITTENGRVYLMGLVSVAEGQQAETIAASVNGVQRVVSLFDYLD
ncbi:BON domain-containing protein [Salinispirillum marinum]|uniref:BON domain-containing protein n=2 Tax=Saccharospirillaceae TaxID=255527 RepID=A0ABV8BAP3_9GAMM